MDSADDIKSRIRRLLFSQKLAVLSTQGKDGPYTSLVAFVPYQHLKSILFATPHYTQKYKNLKKTGRVALLIDNRENRSADFRQGSALTILGTANELQGESKKTSLSDYIKTHPELKNFAFSSSTRLFRVDIRQYSLTTEFQNVEKLMP